MRGRYRVIRIGRREDDGKIIQTGVWRSTYRYGDDD